LEIATRKDHPVMVRLLVWHDDVLSQRQMKNIPGYYGGRFPIVGCAEGGYYSESHQNYNADWFEKVCTGKIDNICFQVRSIASYRLALSLWGEDFHASAKGLGAALYATH